MSTKEEDNVIGMIEQAGKASKSEDALRFSQAALNTAHALQVLARIESDRS
jgi:hypothetical protein